MTAGRPLKFNSPEHMQELIDSYFERCKEEGEPLTVTGLCLALDCDKSTLQDYGKKEEFSFTVKKAKLKIENYLELSLYRSANVGGIIFNLKANFGYTDNINLQHSSDPKSPPVIQVNFIDPKK